MLDAIERPRSRFRQERRWLLCLCARSGTIGYSCPPEYHQRLYPHLGLVMRSCQLLHFLACPVLARASRSSSQILPQDLARSPLQHRPLRLCDWLLVLPVPRKRFRSRLLMVDQPPRLPVDSGPLPPAHRVHPIPSRCQSTGSRPLKVPLLPKTSARLLVGLYCRLRHNLPCK